MFADITKVFTL